MVDKKKKERRISLFLGYDTGENHFVDDAIYDFFNKMPNKSNVIKSILYRYAINNNSGGNIVTATVTPNVTYKVTDNVGINVTESEQLAVTENLTLKATEKEQLDVTLGDTEKDLDIDFEIKKVTPKTKNKTKNDNLDIFMKSIDNFSW